ncbi:hypothetical protein [[Kitasatospora] papulosa]|uniref:hypothetical protein n=1 Tax=[Kitasatospora] papulosa TaxID=1464011 RepID=UPI0036A6AA05
MPDGLPALMDPASVVPEEQLSVLRAASRRMARTLRPCGDMMCRQQRKTPARAG